MIYKIFSTRSAEGYRSLFIRSYCSIFVFAYPFVTSWVHLVQSNIIHLEGNSLYKSNTVNLYVATYDWQFSCTVFCVSRAPSADLLSCPPRRRQPVPVPVFRRGQRQQASSPLPDVSPPISACDVSLIPPPFSRTVVLLLGTGVRSRRVGALPKRVEPA